MLSIVSSAKGNDLQSTKTFSNALNVIVKKFYLENNIKFNFLIYGEQCESFAYDIISNVMQSNPEIESSEIKLEKEHSNKSAKITLMRSTIIFIESFQSYPSYFDRIEMSNTDYLKFQHILVYKEANEDFSPAELTNLPAYYLLYTSISYELGLYRTIKNPFQLILNGHTHSFERNKTCNFEDKTLNIFSIKNQTWENDNFEFEEIKNFDNCVMMFGSDRDIETWKKDILTIRRLAAFMTMKDSLNFQMQINFSIGYNYHASLDHFDDSGEYNRFSFVYIFSEQREALVIALGDEYGPYEKFYLPFDNLTWVWCGIFFGGGFFVIFIIKLLNRREIEDFVFGYNIQSPAFNILVAFFGQSQNILPTRNFSRFILMLFILFCLLIRTAYQGVQFEMMYVKVRNNKNL